MGRRFRFLSVFAVLFAFFYINISYEYSCPSYKKYYECNSGYYLSDCGTSGWTGQSINSPAFGNSCVACPSGYSCSGGTVCPKSSGTTCSPGYYLPANSSTCTACGSNKYYCPGGTFSGTSTSARGRYTVSSGYYSTGGTSATRTGQSQCGGNTYYCWSGVRYIVTSGYYSTGGTSTTRTGQSQCGGNTYYCQSGVRYTVSSGYYSTGGTPTTRTGQSQCTGATYCTGGVQYNCPSEQSNMGNYTYCGSGTIRRYAISPTQWSDSVTQITAVQAKAGAYITSQDANMTCELCPGGYYSEGGTVYECTPCGTESYCSAGFQNMCMDGLSTIGYGPGADEEGDCGRILHVGNNKIYLRSEKKTTPSLNVKIGNLTLYGNMSTSVDAPLKITSGSTTYSVYDDSME